MELSHKSVESWKIDFIFQTRPSENDKNLIRMGDNMKKTITIISEEFENEKTGELVEGVTIIVDGMLKKFLNIIKLEKPEYETNTSIIHDALMRG